MSLRVIFDSNTVLSALVFTRGSLSWLVPHWRALGCVSLISSATAAELTRILAYPKFRLSSDSQMELLADYLPYCEVVEVTEQSVLVCRDVKDQMFLDLAQSGIADVLVSGDQDLLILAEQAPFAIETPESFRQRVSDSE